MGRLHDFFYDSDTGPDIKGMKKAFCQEGCFVLRNFLNRGELKKLQNSLNAARNDIDEKAWTMGDNVTQLVMWNHPGSDVFGNLARSNKLLDIVEELLDGEVYHYYAALVAKRVPASVTTSANWHQDFGHWNRYGCPRPDMVTCIMSLDTNTRDVGGIIKCAMGSPGIGLLKHKETNGKFLVDFDHMKSLEDKFSIEYCELNAGDVLIRNPNLLHYTIPCVKGDTYWEYNVTYNKKDNSPQLKHHHPGYTPLTKVPTSAFVASKPYDLLDGKDFVLPSCDPQLKHELTRSGFH